MEPFGFTLQPWSVCFALGENVNEFFFRVASLAFETSVLAELEKSGSRQIGEVVSEYSSYSSDVCVTHSLALKLAGRPFQGSTATQTTCTRPRRRNSPTAASDDGSSSWRSTVQTERGVSSAVGRWGQSLKKDRNSENNWLFLILNAGLNRIFLVATLIACFLHF